jgi:uncharacterized protein (TIRG00374 family)
VATKRAAKRDEPVVTPLRVVGLFVTAVALYLLAPSIAHVFAQFPRLGELDPVWIGVSLVMEAASFACLWWLFVLVLRTKRWFAVATSQLASNAVSRAVPAGAAAGAAVQYRMLAAGGIDRSTAASGLTAATLLQYATLFALPLIALPATLGAGVAQRLETAAWLGVIAFVVVVGIGALLLFTDRPLAALGRGIEWVINHLPRRRRKVSGLPSRLRTERNKVRRALGRDWWRALLASVGKWAFDYFALLAALAAVGTKADPVLVLLAYTASAVLSMIPITPGGLGFVEAGLTATLVLAGVDASDAFLATLDYRLVSFWLPLPAGAVAAWLFHHRFRRATS